MSIAAPSSAKELKEYVKAKLGADVVSVEISNDQFEIVVEDTLQKFFNYCFDGYTEEYVPITISYGTSTATLDDSIMSVIAVYGNQMYVDNNVAVSLLDVTPLFMNKRYTFNFSRMSHELRVHETLTKDTIFLLHVYRKLNEVQFTDIFNHQWVKKYATALGKAQWGENLMKYDNVILPGEMRLNGQNIFNEGKNEVELAEKELFEQWAFFPLPQCI